MKDLLVHKIEVLQGVPSQGSQGKGGDLHFPGKVRETSGNSDKKYGRGNLFGNCRKSIKI